MSSFVDKKLDYVKKLFNEAVAGAEAEMLEAIEAWFEYWDDRYDGEPLKDYEIKMLSVLRKTGRHV